jgi:hypothetical protein
MIASGSHGPDEPSDDALVTLNSTIAASAATRPTAASALIRSRSRTMAMITVIAGEIDTIGKMRYAGPMVSAWKSSSCPPAPVSPISSP